MRIENECYHRTNKDDNKKANDNIFIGDLWFGSVPTAITLKKKLPYEKSIGEAVF